jgi:hypothetical protein
MFDVLLNVYLYLIKQKEPVFLGQALFCKSIVLIIY